MPQQPRSLRRDAKIAWNQNKGGDARVERSSTAAVIQEFIPNAGTYKNFDSTRGVVTT